MELLDLLGPRRAELLCSAFGGMHIIVPNLRGKMDARMQGRPDMPLKEQLAGLRAMGVEQ